MTNIIGLGLDATDIGRIRATIDRYGTRFLTRIFTEREVAYCMRRREPAGSFTMKPPSRTPPSSRRRASPGSRRTTPTICTTQCNGPSRCSRLATR